METSKGPGWAHFVIDYGPESALLWVVFMDRDGACWTIPNSEVRMCFNWTLGRRKPEAPQKPAAVGLSEAASGASVSVHPAFAGGKAG
jgi:hypothetical protein